MIALIQYWRLERYFILSSRSSSYKEISKYSDTYFVSRCNLKLKCLYLLLVEIQAKNFMNYNMNEIVTQSYSSKLFSDENKVPRTLFGA